MLGARAGPAGATARRRGWPTCLERGVDVFFFVEVEDKVEVEKNEKNHHRFSLSLSVSLPFIFSFSLSLASHIIQQQSTAVPQRIWFMLFGVLNEREREREREREKERGKNEW